MKLLMSTMWPLLINVWKHRQDHAANPLSESWEHTCQHSFRQTFINWLSFTASFILYHYCFINTWQVALNEIRAGLKYCFSKLTVTLMIYVCQIKLLPLPCILLLQFNILYIYEIYIYMAIKVDGCRFIRVPEKFKHCSFSTKSDCKI